MLKKDRKKILTFCAKLDPSAAGANNTFFKMANKKNPIFERPKHVILADKRAIQPKCCHEGIHTKYPVQMLRL